PTTSERRARAVETRAVKYAAQPLYLAFLKARRDRNELPPPRGDQRDSRLGRTSASGRVLQPQRTVLVAFWFALVIFPLGCASPIGIRRVSLSEVDRVLGENALTGERPSVLSRQVLVRLGLSTLVQHDHRA